MKAPLVAIVGGSLFLIASSPIPAQESSLAEKIQHVSPNKKFAMRISYDANENDQLIAGENADKKKIFSETIKAIDLIALPGKQKVIDLIGADDLGSNFDNLVLVWSPDSKWCAFYYNAPRVGYTSVFHQRGDKFVPIGKPEDLRVDVKGDVRNEYIRPIKWTKPGILVLEQLSIFRGDANDSRLELTVVFDANGKFHVLGKKKLKPEMEKE